MNRLNHTVHGAAWVSLDGDVLIVREDVGRHNALDKLIGALFEAETDLASGFVLMTSRCSFELVQKAATVGIGALVTVSAPTAARPQDRPQGPYVSRLARRPRRRRLQQLDRLAHEQSGKPRLMENRDMIRMANQIAAFFEAYPRAEALEGIAKHIKSFWDPQHAQAARRVRRRRAARACPRS